MNHMASVIVVLLFSHVQLVLVLQAVIHAKRVIASLTKVLANLIALSSLVKVVSSVMQKNVSVALKKVVVMPRRSTGTKN